MQDPAFGQRPSLKDHCKMIKKHRLKITMPSLQQWRQQSIWFRLCVSLTFQLADFLVLPTLPAAPTDRVTLGLEEVSMGGTLA